MSGKQTVGWILIAASVVGSIVVFGRAIIERSEVPVTSPGDTPVIILEPLEQD